MAESDEEAFDWGPGTDDTAYRPQAEAEATDEPDAPREPGVWLTAVLGGIYVMWALAWVIGLAQQPTPQLGSALEAGMYSFGQFLAYIATPLWFVVGMWLGTQWTPRTRGGFLVLGLLVLLPWPFILPAVLT